LNWLLPTAQNNDPFPELKLPIALKILLLRRGFNTNSEINNFIKPSNPPEPTKEFPELNKALDRLIYACNNNENIAICGDYDADGLTSSSLLHRTFQICGARPIVRIPSRLKQGYGLNINMIEEINKMNIKLLVTVDNGANSIEPIRLANKLGIDVILTDHHKINGEKPKVLSLIHPSTISKSSPYIHLAGVGLAFILAKSLLKILKINTIDNDLLHLFTIGTIADMAPLLEANRFFIIKGLKTLHTSSSPGISSLLTNCGLNEEKLTSEDISFKIAPRINSVGRIGDPNLIINLLTDESPQNATNLARDCEILNHQRRELSDGLFEESIALIESKKDSVDSFILLAQPHWHPGIIGIAASKIMNKYKRPTALLASESNGLFRASVRSPEGFNIISALHDTSELLENFGGHKSAAGFTVHSKNIIKLHEILNKKANDWFLKTSTTLIKPEVYLQFNEINYILWNHISKLEPFGISNKDPIFWSRKCNVLKETWNKAGGRNLILEQEGYQLSVIEWDPNTKVDIPKVIDIVYNLKLNKWGKQKKLQLNLIDYRKYSERIVINKSGRKYTCYLNMDRSINILNQGNESITGNYDVNRNLLLDNTICSNDYIKGLFDEASMALGLIP